MQIFHKQASFVKNCLFFQNVCVPCPNLYIVTFCNSLRGEQTEMISRPSCDCPPLFTLNLPLQDHMISIGYHSRRNCKENVNTHLSNKKTFAFNMKFLHKTEYSPQTPSVCVSNMKNDSLHGKTSNIICLQ